MQPNTTTKIPDHHTDNSFRNPYSTMENHGFRSVLKWSFSKKPEIPDEYSLPWVDNDLGVLDAVGKEPNITWIGHSTFLIKVAGKLILTDPFFSDRASPFKFAGPRRMVPPAVPLEKLPQVDFVIISHNHYDHLDFQAVKYLAQTGAKFIVPAKMDDWFRSRDMENVIARDWWETFTEDGIAFTATPAQHFSARTPFDRNRILWASWIIDGKEARIYFAGDTGYFPGFKEIGERFPGIDIALLPIGAYEPRWFMKPVHLNPEDAVQAFRDLGAQSAIGMHWGTIKLTDEAMDEPPKKLSLALGKHTVNTKHFIVMAHGETRYWSSGKLEILYGGQTNSHIRIFDLP